MNWLKRLLGDSSPKPSSHLPRDEPAAPMASEAELQRRFGHLSRLAIHLRPTSAPVFSKLGGLPSMPPEIAWPTWQDKPQAFLAQIDLAEISRALVSFLPSSGCLYFFYDQDQGVWGFDQKDLGGWRVLYTNADRSTFATRTAPVGLPEELIFKSKAIAPTAINLLPDSQVFAQDQFEWKRDGEAYTQLRDTVFEGMVRHQMLGYPSPVQGADMETECQLASNGVYVGSPEGYQNPRVPELKPGAKDWRLLLQLDTDDDTGWMWGDVGTLYFWIREQDAKAGDFSRIWMVFQCC
jgi:uncharacterized protein YwqG